MILIPKVEINDGKQEKRAVVRKFATDFFRKNHLLIHGKQNFISAANVNSYFVQYFCCIFCFFLYPISEKRDFRINLTYWQKKNISEANEHLSYFPHESTPVAR